MGPSIQISSNAERPLDMRQFAPSSSPNRAFPVGNILFWLALLILCLALIESAGNRSLLEQSLKDSGHAVVFLVSTYILLVFIQHNPVRRVESHFGACGLSLIISLIVGASIEVIQPWVGRTGSWIDLWLDMVGSAAACLFFLAQHTPKFRPLLFVLSLLVLMSAGVRPVYYLWLQHQQTKALPDLLNVENTWQNELVFNNQNGQISITHAPAGWDSNHSNVLRIEMPKGQYPGVAIKHFSSSWYSYESLYFELYSASSASFELAMRIHDWEHSQSKQAAFSDRFNTRIQVEPGVNHYRFSLKDIQHAPKNRTMDLGAIEGMIIFAAKPETTHTVYLDSLRLE